MRRALGRDELEDLGLGRDDAVDVAEPFEVLGERGGDDGVIGSGHGGEATELARLAGAELEHHEARVDRSRKEGDRRTDLAVLVARGREHGPTALEHLRERLLRRRLAVASGDADDRARSRPRQMVASRCSAAVASSQRTSRSPRIDSGRPASRARRRRRP
jgi:hypothetical protein